MTLRRHFEEGAEVGGQIIEDEGWHIYVGGAWRYDAQSQRDNGPDPDTRTTAERQIDSYGPNTGDPIPTSLVRRYYVGHWFDPDTLRFFGSRIAEYGYRGADGAVYFVSSERDSHGAWDYQRLYTVRRWHPAKPRAIDTVSGFGEYASRNGANKAAQRAAREAGER